MAVDFRARINSIFAIEVPMLELLRGVSVNSLAVRILAELQLATVDQPVVTEPRSEPTADDDIDRLIEQLSEDDLRELLAELEGGQSTGQDARGAHS